MNADREALRTSWTLLARMKDLDDQTSWTDFYELYQRLILGVATKAGLRPDEAEEVLQETMASLAKHIPDFEIDPKRGSFRAWLLNLVRWRIQDQLRKRAPFPRPDSPNPRAPPEPGSTGTIERQPDPHSVDLTALCDAEWEAQLWAMACARLQKTASAGHYQVFHLLVLEKKPIAEVSRLVGRNRAQLYVIKHRMAGLLRSLIRQLERETTRAPFPQR